MSEEQEKAESIGAWMAEHDRLARLLGMELEAVAPGYARVGMEVREEMLNSLGMTHGGATFSLADFAFAVASNSHDRAAVALTAQISYPAASRKGDKLTAEAKEQARSGRTGLYTVEVRTGDQQLVGQFSGNVYRRSDSISDWIEGKRP